MLLHTVCSQLYIPNISCDDMKLQLKHTLSKVFKYEMSTNLMSSSTDLTLKYC